MERKAKTAVNVLMDPGKAARVEQERTRIMELFTDADPNKLDFIRDAVLQLSWLGITILELQAEIDQRGPVVPYRNGRDQTGLQANPACKTLKDFQTLYNTQFRALLPVLPEKQRKGSKLEMLRSQQELIDSLFEDDEDPEEKAEREREYEERQKKAQEDFQRAVEQQRREREQKQASGLI